MIITTVMALLCVHMARVIEKMTMDTFLSLVEEFLTDLLISKHKTLILRPKTV